MSFNSDILNYLKNKKFVPSKKMGQNFLISDDYQKKIVNLLEIQKDDNVLEIGPGLGSLTRWIYEYQDINFTLVELDKRLFEKLNAIYKNASLINDDILKYDLTKSFDIENKSKNKVVSNLPYSISSKSIIKIVKSNLFAKAVFMIQKEMGERITAKVNSKKYNNFTVLLNILCDIKKEFDVQNTVFVPQPEVDSTVISITNKTDFDFSKTGLLEKFLKMCFSQKRKKIINNLKPFMDIEKANKILELANIDKTIRPENIPINDFVKMFEVYLKCI